MDTIKALRTSSSLARNHALFKLHYHQIPTVRGNFKPISTKGEQAHGSSNDDPVAIPFTARQKYLDITRDRLVLDHWIQDLYSLDLRLDLNRIQNFAVMYSEVMLFAYSNVASLLEFCNICPNLQYLTLVLSSHGSIEFRTNYKYSKYHLVKVTDECVGTQI